MGDFDVEGLLKNGYWPSSRARNTGNTGSRNNLPPVDQTVPRRLPYHTGRRKPPPPSVEDENEAVAKEAGSVVSSVPSEEPTNRGDPDQYPIILPRRFVLVSEDKPSLRREPAGQAAELPYEANTSRKLNLSAAQREAEANRKKETWADTEHHRSRPGDLPPIITGGENDGPPHDSRRAKSTAADGRSESYVSTRSPSTSPRVPREHSLAPEIIEHATKGHAENRDRPARPNDQYDQKHAGDRKHKERESRSAHSTSPTLHKRRAPEVPRHARHSSREESYESSRQFGDGPSSKSSRKISSSTHSRSGHNSGSRHSSTTGNTRTPSSYDDAFYSSDDEPLSRADAREKRSGRPTGKTNYLTTPVESWGTGRRKSRGQSPRPSLRPSHDSVSGPSSTSPSSRSATFPRESPPSQDEDHAGRPLSRAATSRGSFTSSHNTIPAALAPATSATSTSSASTSVDQRSLPVPPMPRAGSITDSKVPSSIPSTSTLTQPTWPPPKLEPPENSAGSSRPISSYRRYSVEAKTGGELPDIPHCPRTREEAGHMDWLTLPRCDNFNICPSCYDANFASTEFAHDFVLMPFRPSDKPLACDFGASEFYRIAWLFTRKYRRPDLGLLHSLTRIAARGQPCRGHREVSRVWYSVRDPSTGRPVDGFTVCDACAITVETLLPGLRDLFVPFDTPAERTRGVCAMHHDHRDGNDHSSRFLLYFDVLEGEADRALATQAQSAAGPDVQALADRIRQIAAVPPCRGDRKVFDGYWHTMRDVPIFVCPECFMMVVQPLLLLDGSGEGEGDITVAGQFHHALQPPEAEAAQCMLYSDRMRSVFGRAVARRDLPYLKAKVLERIKKKAEYDARMDAIQRRGLGTPWAEAETERAIREWKRYE
ncbi:hypothetical protein F5Y14DRAFT_439350 [Nemania sp. NC0429]|nr:hypothetical protein F5Y14DRAFT_439350 [Nemania sp. NC0429]